MSEKDVEKYAKKIWDYMRIDDKLRKADVIVMFGSHDPSVATYAIQLYLEKYAPLLLLSGGRGSGTEHWKKSEADTFAAMARNMGVPDKAILVENKSTNTAENIEYTKKLLKENNIHPRTIIIVQKPFMGRRVLATIQKEWNDIEFIITSPPVPFEKYKIPELTREEMIGSMVGDLERLKLYGEKDFQTKQDIPAEVWDARNKIREAGIVRRYVDIPN